MSWKVWAGIMPEPGSGKFAEHTSRRSRVSERRLPSTSSFGPALFCNTRSKPVVFSKTHLTFYFSAQEPHQWFLRIVSRHWLIFLTLGLLCKTRTKMLVRKQTPITSAAIAVRTHKGTAILLIVTHLFLSTPPVPEGSHRRPLFSIIAFVHYIFSLSFCSPICPVIGMLIVFPEDVLNVIINLCDRMYDFSFPPRVQCLLNMANFPRVFLSQSILTVDPTLLSPHSFTVGLSSPVWMVLSAGPSILWCFVFSLFFLFLPNSCPVHRRVVHALQRKSDESLLVFKRLAFRSFTGPVLIAGPFSCQLAPDAPSIVPAPPVFPPSVVARVVFHFKCMRGLPPFRASPS